MNTKSHIKQTECPYCGKLNDRSRSIDEYPLPPKDGDASLCVGCGCLSIFDSKTAGGLRTPSWPETKDMLNDPVIPVLIDIWNASMRRRRPGG